MISGVLAGGRAPRSWQRGIARATAPLRALGRATAWLAKLAGVRPALRDEPLLGRCFTDLALQPFPAGEPQKAAARPVAHRPRLAEDQARRSRPAAGEQRSREARGRRGASGSSPSSSSPLAKRPPRAWSEPRRPRAPTDPPSPIHDPEEPRRLAGRAGRELLCRLAGPDATSPTRAASPPGPIGSPAGPAAEPPPVPWERTSHRGWLEHLARRVGRSLGGLTAPGSAAPDQASRELLERWLDPGLEPETSSRSPRAVGSTAFEAPAPWLLPLTGETAPGELLERWLDPGLEPETSSRSPRAVGSAAFEAPAPWLLPLTGETAPGELLERWQRPPAADRGGSSHPARPGFDPPPPGGRSPQVPSPESRRGARPSPGEAPASSPSHLEAESSFAPPPAGRDRVDAEDTAVPGPAGQLLAPPPSLPSFLQPRGAGDGITRRPDLRPETVLVAPRGPAAPAEDLSALAAKIQRILEDETRRHGIPV